MMLLLSFLDQKGVRRCPMLPSSVLEGTEPSAVPAGSRGDRTTALSAGGWWVGTRARPLPAPGDPQALPTKKEPTCPQASQLLPRELCGLWARPSTGVDFHLRRLTALE